MIQVEFRMEGKWVVKMDVPEQHAIKQISEAYRIPNEAAVVAVINRGMDSIGRQLKDNPITDGESHGCPHSG